MNITQFFKDLTKLYNSQNKCGFCWSLNVVEGEDGMNSIKLTDEDKCCIQVIIVWEQKNYSEQYNHNTTAVTNQFCDNQFIVYFVKGADIGTNFGNETPGHNFNESIISEIINPLFECLTCANIIDICSFGYDFGIQQWTAARVLFKGDQNFSGLRITGNFREKIYP